ncbi:hypothetical protein B0T17DRAFT_614298 [Bombardia bombarda]|uniref:DUF7779 domain-containing protein n=1 Tax=Bombardia bombarda TaxID=252184 RepID=A0AA40C8D6_9PEZI|nr:hypothetical protein B0T17DRAFT_614298 [Bombardia bombarda]
MDTFLVPVARNPNFFVGRAAWAKLSRFDAVFWVHADSVLKLRDEFGRLAISLDLVDEISIKARDHAITRDLVKGWLQDPVLSANSSCDDMQRRRSWLLVFDNVDDPDVLEGFWPLDGPGCVLFTSRDSLATQSPFIMSDGVELKSFSREQSSSFLQKLTGKQGNTSGVYDRLGGLPLAITQMASIIIRDDLSYDEFVQNYDERGLEELFQLRFNEHSQQSAYRKTIWSVWAIESLKHGKPLLNVMSMLDPDGILESTLMNPPEVMPLVDHYPRNSTAYQIARTELLQSSLISMDSLEKRLVVHRLIQDTTRAKMSPHEFERAFYAAVHLVLAVWPFQGIGWRHSTRRWDVCEKLFPQVVCLRRFGTLIEKKEETFGSDLSFSRLLSDAGWYYHERGHSSDAVPFFDSAFKICESIRPFLEDSTTAVAERLRTRLDDVLLELHHNMGSVGTETNDPQSTMKHFKICNDMMIEKSGDKIISIGQDRRLAVSWNELGNAYMMNHMWEKGEECFNNCIKSFSRLEGFIPTDSVAYKNLGLVYWLTGRNEAAEEALLIGLRQREDVYGVDDSESFFTGSFLHALGNVKESQGDLVESFKYHKRALRHHERTIGKNHHRTGDIHVRVADHLLRDGKLADAEHHLREALRIFGGNDVFKNEKARALHRLSLLLTASKRDEEAAMSHQEATTLYKELYPSSNKAAEDLVSSNFDDAVAFWSR